MSRFQILPHADAEDNAHRKFIAGGQVIRLRHTELGGYLTSDDLDFTADGLAEVYIRKHNSPDPKSIEHMTSGDLFEIEIAKRTDG